MSVIRLKLALNTKNLQFGDYILFQKYKNVNNGKYKVSKPIYGIYLGSFICDMAFAFNYIEHINENHIIRITNKYVTQHPMEKTVGEVQEMIEWTDYTDMLGHWKNRPSWKEILAKYRLMNYNKIVDSKDINI